MTRACPAICDVAGCGNPAAKMPTLQYWALGYPRDTHPPMVLDVGLAVCVGCANKQRGRELTDHHHALACTTALAQRRALPAKDTAQVKWWNVGDPKAPHARVWAKT